MTCQSCGYAAPTYIDLMVLALSDYTLIALVSFAQVSPNPNRFGVFLLRLHCMMHHYLVENELVSFRHQLLHTGVSEIYLPQLTLLPKRAPNQLSKCHHSLKDLHHCHQHI